MWRILVGIVIMVRWSHMCLRYYSWDGTLIYAPWAIKRKIPEEAICQYWRPNRRNSHRFGNSQPHIKAWRCGRLLALLKLPSFKFKHHFLSIGFCFLQRTFWSGGRRWDKCLLLHLVWVRPCYILSLEAFIAILQISIRFLQPFVFPVLNWWIYEENHRSSVFQC